MHYSYTFKMNLPVQFTITGAEFMVLRRNGVFSRIRNLRVTVRFLSSIQSNLHTRCARFEVSGHDVGKAIVLLGKHLNSFKMSKSTPLSERIVHQTIKQWSDMNSQAKWIIVRAEFLAAITETTILAPLAFQSDEFEFPVLTSIRSFFHNVREYLLRSAGISRLKKPGLFVKYMVECQKSLRSESNQSQTQTIGVVRAIAFVLTETHAYYRSVYSPGSQCDSFARFYSDLMSSLEWVRGLPKKKVDRLRFFCHCKAEIMSANHFSGLVTPDGITDVSLEKLERAQDRAEVYRALGCNRHFHICAMCGVVERKKHFKVCRLCRMQCLPVQYYFCSHNCQIKSWVFHKWFHRVLNGRFAT